MFIVLLLLLLFFRAVNHVIVLWPVKVLSAKKIRECVNVNLVLLVERVIDVCQDFGIILKKDA